METRLSNIFKTTNVTNFTKAILKSSYRVLQVTSKWKTLKQPVYVLKTVEFCSTFDIQIDIPCKSTLFRKRRELSQNTSTFIPIGPPITKQRPFKKIKELCFFAVLFQNGNWWRFKFLMNQILGQRFIMSEKLRYGSQLWLKLRAVKVATTFHWISSGSN